VPALDPARSSAASAIALLAASIALGIVSPGRCLAQPPNPPAFSLPPTRPTELPASNPGIDITRPTATLAHPATVTYTGGRLQIVADDSSLNQILREVSRKTGMTITGGVGDERVFGTYGPAAPAKVLASLLDGTDSNMLLRETSSNAPAELILTPRGGGPTPPSPNASGGNDDDLISRQPRGPVPNWAKPPTAYPPMPVSSQAAASGAAFVPPGAATAAAAPSDGVTPAPQPAAADLPQSPNGVKTPQQIFQQLQQLQQQQQQQQPPKPN
jgi:hypothetical protein